MEKVGIRETSGRYEKLEAIIRFPYGSRLDVNLTLAVSRKPPRWLAYSFHYITGESVCIFKYDNADHYRGLRCSPHHKHEGLDEMVSGCPEPSVPAIRDEIESYLRTNS